MTLRRAQGNQPHQVLEDGVGRGREAAFGFVYLPVSPVQVRSQAGPRLPSCTEQAWCSPLLWLLAGVLAERGGAVCSVLGLSPRRKRRLGWALCAADKKLPNSPFLLGVQ